MLMNLKWISIYQIISSGGMLDLLHPWVNFEIKPA